MSSPTIPFGSGVPPPDGTTSTRVTTCVPIGTIRLGWRSRTIEDPHLSRRTHLRILLADRQNTNVVFEALCNPTGPTLKFSSRPLEAVIFMAKVPCRQSVEFDIVFSIWRRHDDRLGTR